MGHYCYTIVPGVLIEAWMASTVDRRAFLVVMFRLASNHTGNRVHLQRINVMQDSFDQYAMGYDTFLVVQFLLFLLNHLTEDRHVISISVF
jgi:hypothetical protein